MTKIGKRGFMMAEVVVVSVIVAVTLVTLYTGINRVTTAFNLRNRYYDMDCLNLSIAANNILIKTDKINSLLINSLQDDKNPIEEINDADINNLLNLYSEYSRRKIYFLKNGAREDQIDSYISVNDVTVTIQDYFDYLQNNYDDDYTYYIVSELCKKDENDCYYYGLGVR